MGILRSVEIYTMTLANSRFFYLLGELSPKKIITLAKEEVKSSTESPSLNTLSTYTKENKKEIFSLYEKSLAELEIPLPSYKEALFFVLQFYIEKTVNHTITPYKGARIIQDTIIKRFSQPASLFFPLQTALKELNSLALKKSVSPLFFHYEQIIYNSALRIAKITDYERLFLRQSYRKIDSLTLAEEIKHLSKEEKEEIVEELLFRLKKGKKSARKACRYMISYYKSYDIDTYVKILHHIELFYKPFLRKSLLNNLHDYAYHASCINSFNANTPLYTAIACAKVGIEEALPVLKNIISQNHPFDQISAIKALGYLKKKETIKILLRKMHDTNPFIQDAAVEALLRFNHSEFLNDASFMHFNASLLEYA